MSRTHQRGCKAAALRTTKDRNVYRPYCFYRFARHLLIHHRGIVNEGGHDGRRLLHVVRLNPVVDVRVRMMRSGVVDRILEEVEAGQADFVEGDVIGSARRVGSERFGF